MMYQPVKRPFLSSSEATNRLLKIKRIYLNFGATLDEWRDLADEFLADGGRANHAFCMCEFKRLGGVVEPVVFEYIPPEPEVPAPAPRGETRTG